MQDNSKYSTVPIFRVVQKHLSQRNSVTHQCIGTRLKALKNKLLQYLEVGLTHCQIWSLLWDLLMIRSLSDIL